MRGRRSLDRAIHSPGRGSAAARSEDATSEWDVDAWLEQHHGAVRIGHAQEQHLRAHRTNLPRGKVDDGDNQLAAQLLGLVVHGQLGARAPDAEWTKIDAKLVGRLAGFREGLGL